MRVLILALPAILALSACSTAEQAVNDTGNAAESAGAAIDNGAEQVAGTAGQAADAVGNAVEGVGNAVEGAVNRDAWIGRWTGVEGTYLAISKGTAPGRYRLEMQYTLDANGSYDGVAAPDGIAFTRPDGNHVLRASDGDATGLKYLAGKKDCLKVKDGEGYCRD